MQKRREFLQATALLLTSLSLEGAPQNRLEIIGFIKPIQKRSFTEIADIAEKVGWRGIECPVRKDGSIEPDEVEEKLPKLLEILRGRSLSLPVIATDIEDAENPLTHKVLKTASKLGIKRYRMKHLYYDLDKPIRPQLEAFSKKIRALAKLNKELGVQGTIQNHSGRNYVGAPVWDIAEMVQDIDPKEMAIYFDIGHATIEGGSSWPIESRLVEPHLAVVSVKDFTWQKAASSQKGSEAAWCPLGEGMVNPEYFHSLRKSSFTGPVSQHFEYPLGSGEKMIQAMKKDREVLGRWLQI